MIAALHLLHWAAAVMRRQDSTLVDVPLVIGGQAWESAPVLALSAEAAAAGVRVGMPLKQAGALCPQAVFLPPDEAVKIGLEFPRMIRLKIPRTNGQQVG